MKNKRRESAQGLIIWKAYILLDRGYIPKSCNIKERMADIVIKAEIIYSGFGFLKSTDARVRCIRGTVKVKSPRNAQR